MASDHRALAELRPRLPPARALGSACPAMGTYTGQCPGFPHAAFTLVPAAPPPTLCASGDDARDLRSQSLNGSGSSPERVKGPTRALAAWFSVKNPEMSTLRTREAVANWIVFNLSVACSTA
jgi:hypothetical protein